MRLSEFIEDTLYEIALGIDRARMKARDLAAINPSRLDGEPLTEKSFVDFDVSIVVGESEERGKGAEARLTGEIKVATVAKVGIALGGKSDGTSNAQQPV